MTEPHLPGAGHRDLRPLDRAVAAVGADLEELKFNTAIASLMELVRWAREQRPHMSASEWSRVARTTILLLAPFAPHLAEELRERVEGEYSVHRQAWPEHDDSALLEETITLVIQVNGKTRDTVTAPAGIAEADAFARVHASPAAQAHMKGRAVKRVVFVPDRLINVVV